MKPSDLHIQRFERISDIPEKAWDALVVDNHPFMKHAFLNALEIHECVSEHYGWHPHHFAVYKQNQLIAAIPVYEKHNNYGEFVFDQAWQNAWQQIGLPYYPKLVSTTPYTPVMGQRFLYSKTLSETEQQIVLAQLMLGIQTFCETTQMSGFHILFANPKQQKALAKQPEQLIRHDCQFHWFNQRYETFNDFLATLTAKKRKNIRQERKSVAQAGIKFRVLNGETATEQDWQTFNHLYQKTFVEKWSTPTLNLGFFNHVAEHLPKQVVLVLADQDNECVAGALMFQSDTHLYGRHWGCFKHIKHLHFETCFYQGIEYAITNKLGVFEPGAGGEHKIARGFIPIETRSFHWLTVNPFPQAIDRFLSDEHLMIQDYIADCEAHAPYQTLPELPTE